MKTDARATVRPPGPNIGFGRVFLANRRDPLGFHIDLARRFGDNVYFKAGPFRVYLLSHPDLIRDVLVTHNHAFTKSQGLQEAKRIVGEGLLTSEGAFHKRQRRLIQPVFHQRRIEGYGRVMVEDAARLRDGWHEGQTLDVSREMNRLTLGIVAKTLFGTDIESEQARRVAQAITTAFELFDRFLVPFSAYIERLPLPSNRRFAAARQTLDEVVFDIIRHRRESGDTGDLVSMLLAAADCGESMTDRQVRDEAMTIFLAGHETTSVALTWTMYLLSQHPDVEARLHREIGAVIGDRLPAPADVPNLPFAERILSESLRLYPPAWILGRLATQAVEVGGYVLPSGSTAVMCQYAVHHDPRWWPDPYRFDPDRWLPGAAADRPKFAYFPFGGGPRLCIGEGFAWMEGILLLVTLAQRWRFRLAPGHSVELLPLVTLRPRFGMRITLERR